MLLFTALIITFAVGIAYYTGERDGRRKERRIIELETRLHKLMGEKP
jgi:hypothetical protein